MRQISKEKATFFLLQFTKELIIQSTTQESLTQKSLAPDNIPLQEIKIPKEIPLVLAKPPSVSSDTSENKEIFSPIQKKVPQIISNFKPLPKQSMLQRTFSRKRLPLIPTKNKVLTIPAVKLPSHLQYLKPIPREIKIDLGKLNPLINDHRVKTIECNGPREQIIVSAPSKKLTNIILNEEEINQIIEKFSKTAKIPIQIGILKIVVGKLILSSIISEVIGTKFIIQKMNAPSQFMQR